ncbi:MAG: polysaccharide pyruvyl transferase CsaB [Ruminococcaceae bacterium]|nr:polysaccharide pyruvyl transferase CsaB [Oscillospiraceae bacterium]
MRVLHLISGGDTGGAKTHVFALLDALKNMAKVKIVCLMPGAFYEEIRARGVDATVLPQKSRLDLSVVGALRTLIEEEQYEIVHAHGARANFIAQRLKKNLHIPVITTVHSDYRLDFDGLYRKIVYTGLNMLALRKMDYYIAVSSSFRNMLISRGFQPGRIHTVYNGMDYSEAPVFDDKERFAKRIGIPYSPDCIYVGLIGRHDFVKGHDVFVKAAAQAARKNPRLRFLIAGDGEGREALVQLAKAEGLEDKLVFTGFIRDIYSFINFIDINTLSSRSESFPYVLLEGARLRKATISSAVGGIPDLITDGETGFLFPSEDDTAFADRILELAEDREKRERLGDALYRRATENFSNESLARAHIGIYERVLKDYYDTKKYDVVLSGYYGFHNSGDDALLKAILDSLHREKPDIRPLVLSACPRETELQYGVDAMYRFNMPALYRIMGKARMLINGGGSLLQDVTSSQSLWYYLWVMRIARKRGAAVYIYANGIGPLRGKNRLRAARAIEKTELISLRDTASLEEIKSMGVRRTDARVTADPALALSACRTKGAAVLQKAGVPEGRRCIGISLLDWSENDKAFYEKMAECIDYAAQKYDLVPLFIPMKKQADSRTAAKIATHLAGPSYRLEDGAGVAEVISAVGSCALIIGMRLHALIYAAGSGVPVVGLAYDPKVTGFMEYIGQNRICNIDRLDTERLKQYIDEVCTRQTEIRSALSQKAEELKEKAEENAKICVRFLEEKDKENGKK